MTVTGAMNVWIVALVALVAMLPALALSPAASAKGRRPTRHSVHRTHHSPKQKSTAKRKHRPKPKAAAEATNETGGTTIASKTTPVSSEPSRTPIATATSSPAQTLLAVTSPSTNCTVTNVGPDWDAAPGDALNAIDSCRAQEGLGPLILPTNWNSLDAAQQLFVITDLERVNRGLEPIAGMTDAANADALIGAENNTDPTDASLTAGPDGAKVVGFGSIWAGTGSVFLADLGWMYEDGWTSSGFVENLDCTGPAATLCWGHRDNILSQPAATIAGGAQDGSSLAVDFTWLTTVPSELDFSWSAESTDFGQTPGAEPLGAPVLTAVTGANQAPGNVLVTITGNNLLSVESFTIDGQPATHPYCTSETSCSVVVTAPSFTGNVTVSAQGYGGNATATLPVGTT